MKKKTWMIALALAFSIPALASTAKDNPNQDFTGTPVTVETTDSEVKITIQNVADRGLPDVSIWSNGVRVASYAEIGKGKTVTHVINVNTNLVGIQTFDIVVWTRLGNKNFQDILFADTAVVEVKGYVSFRANGGVFSSGLDYTGWEAYSWDEEIVFPANNPTRDGYVFVGWATQWSSDLLLPGITYADLVGGNNTMTSESIWAQWEPVPPTTDWVAIITAAINEALDGRPIQSIVDTNNNGTSISLSIDGETYVFTSNGAVNSTKSLVIEGVLYKISPQGNGGFSVSRD